MVHHKNIYLAIVFLLFSTMMFSQVELKGYKLGEKLKGEQNQNKETTVAGIDGMVMAYGLNDNRIYRLIFSPVDITGIDIEPKTLYYYQLSTLVEGIEKKYGVELEFREYPEDYSHNYALEAIKDGVEYRVMVKHVLDEKEALELVFFINDNELSKLHEEELQSDF